MNDKAFVREVYVISMRKASFYVVLNKIYNYGKIHTVL